MEANPRNEDAVAPAKSSCTFFAVTSSEVGLRFVALAGRKTR